MEERKRREILIGDDEWIVWGMEGRVRVAHVYENDVDLVVALELLEASKDLIDVLDLDWNMEGDIQEKANILIGVIQKAEGDTDE